MAATAFKIERFVLAERVELTNDAHLLPVNEVPAAIQLLNPSPGVMDMMVEFEIGLEATGLEPNAPVSEIIELCHEDVGKWLRIRQDNATVGPEGGRRLLITNINFSPGREHHQPGGVGRRC